MSSTRFDARLPAETARGEGSGIFVIPALSLRRCLSELTDALARAERDQVVLLDVVNARARAASRVDADAAAAVGSARVVLRPDGLWEWMVRRDFVRSIRREHRKDAERLAATLGGPRSRSRFALALTSTGDAMLVRAFDLHRRRRLRAWAGRVLRATLGALVSPLQL